jgi:hypothetical protein
MTQLGRYLRGFWVQCISCAARLGAFTLWLVGCWYVAGAWISPNSCHTVKQGMVVVHGCTLFVGVLVHQLWSNLSAATVHTGRSIHAHIMFLGARTPATSHVAQPVSRLRKCWRTCTCNKHSPKWVYQGVGPRLREQQLRGQQLREWPVPVMTLSQDTCSTTSDMQGSMKQHKHCCAVCFSNKYHPASGHAHLSCNPAWHCMHWLQETVLQSCCLMKL